VTSQLQVLLALGNVPGGNFNTVLVPTFQETGPENFCFGGCEDSGKLGGDGGHEWHDSSYSGGHWGSLYAVYTFFLPAL
jgi:hypothetical protein